MTERKLPRVALVLTGGTIDSVGKDRRDLCWYWETGRRLEPGQLLGAVPELEDIAKVEAVPFRRLSSGAVTPADWLELLRTLHELLEQEWDAAVVTHGTNTLEETAWFVNLTLKTDKPVVFTGAMRPSSAISADGYLNLVNAVRVAGEPASRRRGVLVVLNDSIHAARDVTKTNTYRVQTFDSPGKGPLGVADGDRISYYRRPVRKHTTQTEFDARTLDVLPRVDVVLSYPGCDGVFVDAAIAAGARGIVSAGTGAGRPTPAEDEALDRAVGQGIVVCQASRTGSGRVARSPQLVERRIVTADDLPPWKARILLMLALTRTTNVDDIQRMFEEH